MVVSNLLRGLRKIWRKRVSLGIQLPNGDQILQAYLLPYVISHYFVCEILKLF